MTTFTYYTGTFLRHTGRMLVWAIVGAGITALIGMWFGLWFGSYYGWKHDDVARFWSAFSFCTAAAAASGAITGTLAFLADGTNPFSSETRRTAKSGRITETGPNTAVELPAALAVRIWSNPLKRTRTAHEA